MFNYHRNTIGIKEKTDLENASIGVKQVDEMAGNALVDLGDVAAGNMEAISELGDVASEAMDAIAELAEMVAALEERVAALENQ